MPTPRRRSSRLLRSGSATPAKPNYASNRLQSLTERDETPQSSSHTLVSSPSVPRTPATAGRVIPSTKEMHPSKAQHSTTKEPDSGLRLGFTDIKAAGPNQPSGLAQQTPSKTTVPDSTFEFTFARPVPTLGPEAQRMMDELRGEALRIKARLAAEREEEKRREEEAGTTVSGRKIAQPKGKASRFSDVHMAEFKKMDSIAGHPSSFRAQPGRFVPVQGSLKRTQSKAQLNDREEQKEHNVTKASSSDRLENTSPAKRARKRVEDDTSSARPVSRHDGMPSTPTQGRSFATITTPTQASLAKTNANNINKQIPVLTRPPTRPILQATPQRLPQLPSTKSMSHIPISASKSFFRSPGKLDRMKSILRHPSASLKKPSTGPSTIPTLSRSPSRPNLDKSLPSLPATPRENTGKTIKHVNFTPDTIDKNASTVQNSPSPMKTGIPRSISRINFGGGSSIKKTESPKPEPKTVSYPSFASHPVLANKVEYPSLTGLRAMPNTPRQIATQLQSLPSVPGTFTFRSDHTINFGASPNSFGSSPGQASVRQVRQSILPQTMPGSFPGGNKENTEPLPSVPHGMSNKKRRRVESDDEEEGAERSPKKQKAAADGAMLFAPKLQAQKISSSPVKKKGILSLSRLNMLARPKNRR